jgi:hypothetical protein
MRVGVHRQWLWRAVDEHGRMLDVLLLERRDTKAAERFFRRLLTAADGGAPARLTTDKLGSYAAAKARLPDLADAEHLHLRSAMRCNNRVEQAHQPTCVWDRVMRRPQIAAVGPTVPRGVHPRVQSLPPRPASPHGPGVPRGMRERGATWREVGGCPPPDTPRSRPPVRIGPGTAQRHQLDNTPQAAPDERLAGSGMRTRLGARSGPT